MPYYYYYCLSKVFHKYLTLPIFRSTSQNTSNQRTFYAVKYISAGKTAYVSSIYGASTALKGPITILIAMSPLVGIMFLEIPFTYEFASKVHIKGKKT